MFEILESARRHGVSDEDIEHAIRNPIRVVSVGDIEMFIGADTTGRLIEVGVLADSDDELVVRVIHAMPARPKFLR